jgi:hypothetical protein
MVLSCNSFPPITSPELGRRIGLRAKKVEEIRAELAKMSDAQLIEHGKLLRKSCRRLPGQKIDKEKMMQLNEARAEWQRRYPPKKFRRDTSLDASLP